MNSLKDIDPAAFEQYMRVKYSSAPEAPPVDASTPVQLTRADIDTLLAALNTHQTGLCEAWERASDRGGHAQAAEINRRMAHVDRLAASLRDAANRL